MRKRRASALKIAKNFSNKVIKRLGQTTEERYIKKIRDSFTLMVISMKDRKEERAKETLLTFIRDTKNIFDMKVQLGRFQKHIG
jgi:hypothetical protein